MSRELDSLRDLARAERLKAWQHARTLPAHVGATASAFARKHPVLATGGAAALVMTIVSTRRRRRGIEGKAPSWPMALAAVGANFLPDILRAVGLALPLEKTLEEKALLEEKAPEENGSPRLPSETLLPTDPIAARTL